VETLPQHNRRWARQCNHTEGRWIRGVQAVASSGTSSASMDCQTPCLTTAWP